MILGLESRKLNNPPIAIYGQKDPEIDLFETPGLRVPQCRYNLVYTHVGTIPQSSQCNLDLFLTLNDLSLLAARHCNDSGAIGREICVSEIVVQTLVFIC